MKEDPLGPKRLKLSNNHDVIHDYGQTEKEEYKAYDITKQVEKANHNEKEKEEANYNRKKRKSIYKQNRKRKNKNKKE